MDDLNVTYTLLETNKIVHVYNGVGNYQEIWTELSEFWTCTKSILKTYVLRIDENTAEGNIEAFKTNEYLGLFSIYDFQVVLW